jgi:hypothetical protein
MKRNYDVRYLYLDDKGNFHIKKHKLKKFKCLKLGWLFIKKIYKLRLKSCTSDQITRIKILEPPKIELNIEHVCIVPIEE